MITKMKKLTFLVYHKEYEQFLDRIRNLGVIHVVEKQNGSLQDQNLQDSLHELKHYHSIITSLKKLVDNDTTIKGTVEDGEQAIKEYDALIQSKASIEHRLQLLLKDRFLLAPWGNFSPQSVERLTKYGYEIGFFCSPERFYKKEWESEFNAIEINRENAKVFFITLTPKGVNVDIDAEPHHLPEASLSEIDKAIEQCYSEQVDNRGKLVELANTKLDSLQKAHAALNERIDYSKVVLNTDSVVDNKLKFLQGWVPEKSIEKLKNNLDNAGYFYEIEDPIYGENVPVLLSNNWFARLFEPITNMYSLPNYGELDPTMFFAPFFMLFFGLCLGDGGYGLIILLASLWAGIKYPKYKNLAMLGVFMGGTTMVVGLLTGVFFGIMLESVTWPWLAQVKTMFITEDNFGHKLGGFHPLMVFSVVIGVIQILFAMGFKITKITIQYGLKYAFSDMGWLIGLIVIILYFLLPLLGVNIDGFIKNMLLVIASLCAIVILFYNSPDKNVFVNFGSGLWGTYNMVSGLLGDVLSYIRLFALGLAGGILGNVFNSLALTAGEGLPSYVGWLPILLIMVIGHGLNFVLCVISSVVHPLRLTFVEFYKNADFEGGGKAYRPFTSKIKKHSTIYNDSN